VNYIIDAGVLSTVHHHVKIELELIDILNDTDYGEAIPVSIA